MSKSPLKSKNTQYIIRLEIDGEYLYITYLEKSYRNIAEFVRLSGDPQKGKKLVRNETIENYKDAINEYFDIKKLNKCLKTPLFRLSKEDLNIIPYKLKAKIEEQLKYCENLTLWDDDNFDIKKAFKDKNWKLLRKLKVKLALLFEKESEINILKSCNFESMPSFTISVVEAKSEIRAEKLRRINKEARLEKLNELNNDI